MSPRRLFSLALAAWVVAVGLGLVFGAPLTGDESAYALLARGADVDWLYRPRGMVAIAHVGIALGGSEIAMRLVNALLSIGFVFAVAAVARRAFGDWVAAWSAVLVAGSHAFVMRAPELLGDLPATACLLAALAILLGELAPCEPRPPRYRIVAAAPALAAAFYLRYGSAPAIALIVAASTIAWWRVVWSRPGPMLAMLAVLAALLVPFALESRAETGSITGILVMSSDVASHEQLGSGLRALVLGDPFYHYGALLPPVMLAGLAGLAIARPPPARRIAWLLAVLAIGQLVAIGLVGHGIARYVFFAVVLLLALGVDACARVLAARPSRARTAIRAAGVLATLAWLVLAALQPLIQHTFAGNLGDVMADARAIHDDAAGRPCAVAALAVPQLMWYSGCAGVKLALPGTPVDLPAGARWYGASTPHRPVDPAVLGAAQHADPIPLPAPSAWYLRPR